VPGFTGFPAESLEFLRGLEQDNSKAYFDAHRAAYERAVREPLEELIAEAAALHGMPARVFRPNRDIRFSKDKSPYKTNAAGHAGGPATYYASLDAAGLWVGGGVYHPDRAQLQRIRDAIDGKPGAELDKVYDGLRADGFELASGALKTAPRGYPRDHPRIELLRLVNHAALRHFTPGPDLHDAERARTAVFGTWERLAPLNAWLNRYVGPAAPRS